MKLDWKIGENPAGGIELFGKQREYLPWPEWMVNALPTAHPDVHIAAELMLGTSQRPGAAIAMRRDDFADDWMWVVDEKGDRRMEIYAPPRLRAFVSALPNTGLHLIPKNATEPKGYQSVAKNFGKWRATLGERAAPYTLHGLRKLAVKELAEAGASDAEIQAVTGQSAKTVAYYRQQANSRILSKAAQMRRGQNANGQ